jgi:L-lactate dehydrogenase complex protein LldG
MEAHLSARLRENACTVHVVDRDGVAGTVAERAAAHAAGTRVAITPADPVVEEFDLVARLHAAGLAVLVPDDAEWDDALAGTRVGVTGSAVAVVEPAAIGLATGPGMPRATSFVPPVHVCVVRAEDIVPTFADGIEHLAGTPLPSAFTWIGGPSRTGDLEMVQTLGVHGPVAVEVVIARG